MAKTKTKKTPNQTKNPVIAEYDSAYHEGGGDGDNGTLQ